MSSEEGGSVLYFSLISQKEEVVDGYSHRGSGSLRNSYRMKVEASCLLHPQEISLRFSLLILSSRLHIVKRSPSSPCMVIIIPANLLFHPFRTRPPLIFKTFQMSLYPALSCFVERPPQTARYLVSRNLDQLIKLTITEITEFTTTNQAKSKALDQLKFVLLLGEEGTARHTQAILKALVKVSFGAEEIPDARKKIYRVVEVVGYFVKSSYYIPLVLNILAQEEFKNSAKNTITLLNIFANMLLRSEGLHEHQNSITAALASYEPIFQESQQGLAAIFEIAYTLLRRLQKPTENFLHVAFQIFINIQATRGILEVSRVAAGQALTLLAQKSGFASVAQLHAAEIGPILMRTIQSKEYTSWNRTSKNRFKFDTIVRNCSSQVSRFLQDILQIFEFLVGPQSDLEVRMDTLVLIEYVISIPELHQALRSVGGQLLKRVLIVAIQWKVGKPQIKIRKAGVINIINLIQKKVVSEEQLLDAFKDLFPHLKNCLNDDWAPQLRLASCQLLQKFLLATGDTISDDQLKQIYPLLLQRLDDSQDPIRLKVTAAIKLFFSCRYIKLSQSTLDYVVAAIFIHFDDSNQDIRSAIHLALKHAALADPKLVSKHCHQNLPRMKHPSGCRELQQYCGQLLQQMNS